MKKAILISIAIIFCWQITCVAQKTQVGVTGGLTVSNMRGTVGGKDQKKDSRLGCTFGLILDAPLNDHITFQPGLHYVQKGKKVDVTTDQRIDTALRYAELQLNFLYGTNSDGTTIFIGAGPALSVNFPSKIVTNNGGTKSDADINFGNENADLRGFDFGANFLGGFKFPGGILVSVNYTLGLRNLVPGAPEKDKLKNSCLGFRIGWLIPNK